MPNVSGGGISLDVFGASGARDIAVGGHSVPFGLTTSPPPEVDDVTPDDGATTPVTTPLIFHVKRDSLDNGQWIVELFVKYERANRVEVIYDGTQFLAGYASGSTVVVTGTTMTFNLLPDDGRWPDSPSITYRSILPGDGRWPDSPSITYRSILPGDG